MKSILYVSAHNPYPARSGGQVDIWNRLRALCNLGHNVDLILTLKQSLTTEQTAVISGQVNRLICVQRTSLVRALFSRLPVQMAVRSTLRNVDLAQRQYDLLLLDNEFAGEVLHNSTFTARRTALRVHNEESAYQHKLANAATSFFKRRYFRMEAKRMAHYLPQVWRRMDALWFISSDELAMFEKWRSNQNIPANIEKPVGRLLPAALDLLTVGRPALGNHRVLFVGSLAVTLNQDALRWYLKHVHPLLLDMPDYRFVIVGSTLGQNLDTLRTELAAYPAVSLNFDVPDLTPLFETCSTFVSPMRHGAGVKLKTVEAVLRGLPLVSTTVGAEGSGLLDQVHCRVADDPALFAQALRDVLTDVTGAGAMRDRATKHILRFYNQAEQLKSAIDALDQS